MNRRTRHFAGLTLAAMLAAAVRMQLVRTHTGPTVDTVRPTVNSTNPLNGATGVAVITASFSEAMTASTISGTSFTLTGPGATAVAGTVTYNAATYMATFTPTSALAPGTVYTATVTGAAKDAAGNALATNYSWSFTTAASGGTQAGLVSAAPVRWSCSPARR